MVKEKVISIIKQLTKHDYVEIVTRGNSAITSALTNCKKVLIPEEGGWIHYKTAPKNLGIEVVEVMCDDAKINLKDLQKKAKNCDAFLYQNPGGYFAEQPMKKIYEICKKNDCLVILDCSGGIGTRLCDGRYADIIVGSFGKWKLVDAQVGGFVSCRSKKVFDSMSFERLDEAAMLKMLQKLEELPERIRFLEQIRDKIVDDLNSYNIVCKNDLGFVVVVRYSSEKEKEEIVDYCKENKLPYTECPRYIRLNDKAISIEVKRL